MREASIIIIFPVLIKNDLWPNLAITKVAQFSTKIQSVWIQKVRQLHQYWKIVKAHNL